MSDLKKIIDEFNRMIFPWSAEDSIRIHKALRDAHARIVELETKLKGDRSEETFVAVGFSGGTTFALTGENAGHWVEGGPTHVTMAQFKKVEQDRDAALARLATIDEYCRHVDTESNEAQQGWLVDQIQFTLAQSPAAALVKLKADAWDEGREAESEAQFRDGGYGDVQHPENPYRAESDRIEKEATS